MLLPTDIDRFLQPRLGGADAVGISTRSIDLALSDPSLFSARIARSVAYIAAEQPDGIEHAIALARIDERDLIAAYDRR